MFLRITNVTSLPVFLRIQQQLDQASCGLQEQARRINLSRNVTMTEFTRNFLVE
jgi:hypothetical protein